MSGQLFVISAPSGAGKSTIVKELRKRVQSLGYSISHTSREPRGTEVDGTDYHFVSKETFNRMIETGAFVEWAKVYNDFYGTSFSSIDKQSALGVDVLLDLDARGARNIRTHFQNSVLIYVLPPSLGILEKRLRERGTDNERAIRTRMEKASEEVKECAWYDYVIINDNMEKAVGEAQSVIVAERCRTARQMAKVKDIIGI
jgi:guanylate kinase